jgi:hypothetical protein
MRVECRSALDGDLHEPKAARVVELRLRSFGAMTAFEMTQRTQLDLYALESRSLEGQAAPLAA